MFIPLKWTLLDSSQVLFCLFFIVCQLNRVLDCQVSVLPAHDSAVNIDSWKKRGKIMQSLFAYFNWVTKGTFAVTIK